MRAPAVQMNGGGLDVLDPANLDLQVNHRHSVALRKGRNVPFQTVLESRCAADVVVLDLFPAAGRVPQSEIEALAHAAAVHDPAPARALRVALVNMPWALSDRPSIQCGLLKAGLARAGHQVDVHYFNLSLAASLGPETYLQIAELPAERTLMLGEWLFSVAAFGPVAGAYEYRAAFPVLDEVSARLGLTFAELCDLRDVRLPQWLDKEMAGVDWTRSRYRTTPNTSPSATGWANAPWSGAGRCTWSPSCPGFAGGGRNTTAPSAVSTLSA
jgi:hypothetical protein